MLDENLPTFIFRPMPESPYASVVYFTRSGSDPAPEYILLHADPVSKPSCRGVYAVALTDPYHSSDVVFGEVSVKPEWQMPTLSAAEIRAQQQADPVSPLDTAAAPSARVPDAFVVQLYNPDQHITVRWIPKSWNRAESWEFEIPTQSFRLPSASRLDRAANGPASSAGAGAPASASSSSSASTSLDPAAALAPKLAFRWKRDGRLANKDMTCYMVGKPAVGAAQRSKEPDITVALFKNARDPAVTLYEPNLHRVDVQDRKGLDLVLLLCAQVIRDLYLVPRPDPFHLDGAAADASSGRRRNSRKTTFSTASAPAPAAAPTPMSAAPSAPPARPVSRPNAAAAAAALPSAAAIDAETKRLQAMLEREERERARRVAEEEKRIKKMLEAEEKERQRREAEVAKETERLRKLYGVQGQDLPLAASASASHSRPVPPIPQTPAYRHSQHLGPAAPPLPSRPVSAGPRPGGGGTFPPPPAGQPSSSALRTWWHASSSSSSSHNNTGGRRRGASGSGPYHNGGDGPASSTLHVGNAHETTRIQKKRSVFF